MNEKINESLAYSHCYMDYLQSLVSSIVETDKKEILIDKIENSKKLLKLSDKQIQESNNRFEKLLENRVIYTLPSFKNKEELKTINLLDEKIDNLNSEIDSIEKSYFENSIDLKSVLDSISRFTLLEYLQISSLQILNFYAKIFVLLNKIIDKDSGNFEIVDDFKQSFYPLILKNLISSLNYEDDYSNLLNILFKLEILDLFIIFNDEDNVFSTKELQKLYSLINTIEIKAPITDLKVNCVKIFILQIIDPTCKYLSLYEKYFPLPLDNALLLSSRFNLYNGNKEEAIKKFEKIEIDNLDDSILDIYYQNQNSLDDENFLSVEDTKSLLLNIENKEESLIKQFLVNLKSDPQSYYFLKQVQSALLDSSSFSLLGCELFLFSNKDTLKTYLKHNFKYIDLKDTPSLFAFSVILFRINLISEALYIELELLNKLKECENSEYSSFIEILEDQLALSNHIISNLPCL